jgi:hypothetical protein
MLQRRLKPVLTWLAGALVLAACSRRDVDRGGAAQLAASSAPSAISHDPCEQTTAS